MAAFASGPEKNEVIVFIEDCGLSLSYTVDNGTTVIDAECAKAAGELKTETATGDFAEGIDDAL